MDNEGNLSLYKKWQRGFAFLDNLHSALCALIFKYVKYKDIKVALKVELS